MKTYREQGLDATGVETDSRRRASVSAWGMLEDAFGCIRCEDDTTGEAWRLDSVEQFHPLDKWMFTFKHRNYNGLGPKQFIIEL